MSYQVSCIIFTFLTTCCFIRYDDEYFCKMSNQFISIQNILTSTRTKRNENEKTREKENKKEFRKFRKFRILRKQYRDHTLLQKF